MRETELRIHRDVPPTRGWGYAGAVPGPTLETRSGQGLLVEWANELPSSHFLPIDPTLHGAHPDAPQVRAVVHVHGAKAPPESDGYPEDSVVPGRSVTSVYPTAQEAATLWYHDHAMGLERLNQYAGLFGLFLVRDDAEDALQLPAGEHEIPLLLCDRILGADGQLRYPTSGSARSPWVSEVRGDAILVNGKLRPYLDVRPGAYRLRIVNAANARFFDLSLSGRTPMQQIGADQGLLAAPVTQTKVTLAPAERADVIVDFGDAAGQSVVLSDGASEVMEFRVARGAREKPLRLPPQLRSIPSAASLEAAARATRTLTLGEYVDPAMPERMLMLLDAKRWTDP
jgi:spore coat protein A